MKEFEKKLGGFKKFKTETSDDMFDLSQSTRGNQLSTSGVNLKGAGDTPIGELNRGFESNIGGNKGMNAGGPDFTPGAAKAHSPTQATKAPAIGNQQEKLDDNYSQHGNRGAQKGFGTGPTNQKSFGKQPGYGQKDMSHIDTMKRQGAINKMSIGPNKKSFGQKFFGQESDKKQLGRGLVTAELFGKVGDNN